MKKTKQRKINYSTYLKKTKELENKINDLEYFINNKLFNYLRIPLNKMVAMQNMGRNKIFVCLEENPKEFYKKGMIVNPMGQLEFKKALDVHIYSLPYDEISVLTKGKGGVYPKRIKSSDYRC